MLLPSFAGVNPLQWRSGSLRSAWCAC